MGGRYCVGHTSYLLLKLSGLSLCLILQPLETLLCLTFLLQLLLQFVTLCFLFSLFQLLQKLLFKWEKVWNAWILL